MTKWNESDWARWDRGDRRFDRLRDLDLIADGDELHKLIGIKHPNGFMAVGSLFYKLGGAEFAWIDGDYAAVIYAALKARADG